MRQLAAYGGKLEVMQKIWEWAEPFATRDHVVVNRKFGLRQCSRTFHSDTHPLIAIRL